MYPLQYGGTQKIEMGRGKDTDYKSKLAAAKAQADPQNGYMWGMQFLDNIANNGAGVISSDSRSDRYGNPNTMTDEVLFGRLGNTNYQNDAAGNQYLENPFNQTGYLEGGVSSTVVPQQDPRVMGEQAAMRVAMIQEGVQYPGMNDRRQIYGA